MLIVVGAVKRSPGASTAALALAARWPRPALLVEADPSGADLFFTLRAPGGQSLLSSQRTLMQMAAAAPHAITPQLVHAYTQLADGDLKVLLGTSDPTHTAFVARCWPTLAPLLSNLPSTNGGTVDVIVDAGRWSDAPAQLELVKAASQLVTVVWPASSYASLVQLRDRVKLLGEWRSTAGAVPLRHHVVVRTRTPLRAAKGVCQEMQRNLLEAQIPAEVLGALAEEKAPPELIGGRLGRGELNECAGQLAAALAARPAGPTAPAPAPTSRPPAPPGPPMPAANPLAATQVVSWPRS